MANLSSDLNSLAAIGVADYYRVWKPSSTERQRLIAAKFIVAAAGLLCMAVATALVHTHGSALSLWYTISGIVAGGLAGLFLLAFLAERASAASAYIGIVANILFTTWATLTLAGSRVWDLGRFNFPLHSFMIGVIGQLVLLGAGYAASFVFPNKDQQSREMTLWGWRRSGIAEPRRVEAIKP